VILESVREESSSAFVRSILNSLDAEKRCCFQEIMLHKEYIYEKIKFKSGFTDQDFGSLICSIIQQKLTKQLLQVAWFEHTLQRKGPDFITILDQELSRRSETIEGTHKT